MTAWSCFISVHMHISYDIVSNLYILNYVVYIAQNCHLVEYYYYNAVAIEINMVITHRCDYVVKVATSNYIKLVELFDIAVGRPVI